MRDVIFLLLKINQKPRFLLHHYHPINQPRQIFALHFNCSGPIPINPICRHQLTRADKITARARELFCNIRPRPDQMRAKPVQTGAQNWPAWLMAPRLYCAMRPWTWPANINKDYKKKSSPTLFTSDVVRSKRKDQRRDARWEVERSTLWSELWKSEDRRPTKFKFNSTDWVSFVPAGKIVECLDWKRSTRRLYTSIERAILKSNNRLYDIRFLLTW